MAASLHSLSHGFPHTYPKSFYRLFHFPACFSPYQLSPFIFVPSSVFPPSLLLAASTWKSLAHLWGASLAASLGLIGCTMGSGEAAVICGGCLMLTCISLCILFHSLCQPPHPPFYVLPSVLPPTNKPSFYPPPFSYINYIFTSFIPAFLPMWIQSSYNIILSSILSYLVG